MIFSLYDRYSVHIVVVSSSSSKILKLVTIFLQLNSVPTTFLVCSYSYPLFPPPSLSLSLNLLLRTSRHVTSHHITSKSITFHIFPKTGSSTYLLDRSVKTRYIDALGSCGNGTCAGGLPSSLLFSSLLFSSLWWWWWAFDHGEINVYKFGVWKFMALPGQDLNAFGYFRGRGRDALRPEAVRGGEGTVFFFVFVSFLLLLFLDF